jgi:hypothetical protein
MAVRDYSLTLNGSAQRLSTVLSNTQPGGPQDEAFRQIILAQHPGNSNAIYVGANSTISTTAFGFALDPTQATAADRQTIGPFETGPVKLSEIWVLGTNAEILHIFGIPF